MAGNPSGLEPRRPSRSWVVGVVAAVISFSIVLGAGSWLLETRFSEAETPLETSQEQVAIREEQATTATPSFSPKDRKKSAPSPVTIVDKEEASPKAEGPLVASPMKVPGAVSFQFPQALDHAAYSEQAGHLMGLRTKANQAVIYRIDKGVTKVATVQTMPSPLYVVAKIYKGRFLFIVSSQKTSRIDVFDALNGELVGSTDSPCSSVYQLRTSRNEEDPYVYYTGLIEKERQVRRFHVDKLQDNGRLQLGNSDFQISAYGNMIYGYPVPNRSGDFIALRLIEEVPSPKTSSLEVRTDAKRAPISFSPLVQGGVPGNPQRSYTGPHQCYLSDSNTNIHYSHLRGDGGSTGFQGTCFFPGTPWLFGVKMQRRKYNNRRQNPDTLNVASTIDQSVVARIPLPFGLFPELSETDHLTDYLVLQRHESYRTRLFCDVKHDRLLLSTGDRLLVFPLKGLNLPDQKTLAFDLPVPQTMLLGSSLSIPLTVYDNHEAKTRLIDPPAGMTLTQDRLTWTPGDDSVGRQEVRIERRHGEQGLTKLMAIDVRRPSIMLPLYSQGVALSANGQQAIVWGSQLSNEKRSRDSDRLTELAVVDMRQRNVVTHRHFDQGVLTAAIEGDSVYVLSQTLAPVSNEVPLDLLRLHRSDLTLAGRTDVFRKDRENPRLIPVAGRYLLAGKTRLSLPDLAVLPLPETNQSTQNLFVDGRTDRGWLWDGVLWDGTLQQPQLLIGPSSFLLMGNSNLYSAIKHAAPLWGRYVSPTSVTAASRQSVIRLHHHEAALAISHSVPVALQLVKSQRNKGYTGLSLHELTRGKKVREAHIAKDPYGSSSPSLQWKSTSIDVAGDVGLIGLGSRLFPFLISDLIPQSLNAPFLIVPKQSEMTLPAAPHVTVEYELKNGTPPYEAVLNINGKRIAAKGREKISFSIDGHELHERLLKEITHAKWPRLINGERPVWNEHIVAYLNAVTPEYKRLTGQSPKGVPVLVRVSVEVKDRELSTAELQHAFFVNLPKIEVLKHLGSGKQIRPVFRKEKDREKTLEEQEEINKLLLEVSVDYANTFRESHPPTDSTPIQLEESWAKAIAPIELQLARSIKDKQASNFNKVRTWYDQKGHSTRGNLKTVFAGKVTLSLENGGEVLVPIGSFSEVDQEFINSKGENLSLGDLAVVRMTLVQKALALHVARTGSYPPAYLVNDEGKPLLSWRVLLLEDMGASEALGLLKLDEPWDSKHNRPLLSRMPTLFGPFQEGEDTDKTGILAFRGESSVFASGYPLGSKSAIDSSKTIVVMTNVADKFRVPWASPRDLNRRSLQVLSRALEAYNHRFLVGLADGAVRTTPTGSPTKSWIQAISHSDRESGHLSYGLPIDLDPSPIP